MKRTAAILFILLLVGCKKDNTTTEKATSEKTFYNFDEVDYYKIETSNAHINKIAEESNDEILTRQDTINDKLYKFLRGNYPSKINEAEIQAFLSTVRYHKIKIDKKYFPELRTEIFVEKEYVDEQPPSVAPVYADFFIFKKENKTIGLAKLNSDGRNFNFFAGTNKNTHGFRKNGEIEKLKKILHYPNFLDSGLNKKRQ